MPDKLTDAKLTTLLAQLSTMEGDLPEDTPDLTAAQRQSKRRIGERGAYEISEMAALLRQTTNFLPGNFGPVAEFLDGATEQERWQTLERAATRFLEQVSDARIAQGDPVRKKASAAFEAARQFGQGEFVTDTVRRIENRRKRAAPKKPSETTP